MSNIEIIDNFLEKDKFKKIQNFLLDEGFPWYVARILDKNAEHYENTQFVHTFYKNYIPQSHFLAELNDLLEKIAANAWVRIKANLLSRTEKQIIHKMHVDNEFNCTTSILYINNNNGETVFENGKKIKSKENRFVSFPSKLKHAGTTNTCSSPFRIVLNLNFIK